MSISSSWLGKWIEGPIGPQGPAGPQGVQGNVGPTGTNYCHCFIKFDASNGNIIQGKNVSSISKTGTGTYRINFTNNLPNINYLTVYGLESTNTSIVNIKTMNYTISSFDLTTRGSVISLLGVDVVNNVLVDVNGNISVIVMSN